jgi:hypothetical protein
VGQLLTGVAAIRQEFLDDYANQEVDSHAIVREQEIMMARFEEDLSDEERTELVGKFTELAAELDDRGRERVNEILVGFGLIDEPEED